MEVSEQTNWAAKNAVPSDVHISNISYGTHVSEVRLCIAIFVEFPTPVRLASSGQFKVSQIT